MAVARLQRGLLGGYEEEEEEEEEEAEVLMGFIIFTFSMHLMFCLMLFVIGGADGLTDSLKAEARWQLSLSPMTFPHELARLLLIEQLFRAQAILQGSPYHRA